MHILVLGCSSISAHLVPNLIREGYQVTVMDSDANALDALSKSSGAETMLMTRPLVEELSRAKVLESELFLAITEDDNTNALAAQAAQQLFGVSRVFCQIGDPSLKDMYEKLGVGVVSPTIAIVDTILKNLGS